MTDVRVLVVDDEPITAEAHAVYLRRLDGFEVVGVAHDGKEAIRQLRDSLPASTPVSPFGLLAGSLPGSQPGDGRHRGSIDLVLLDMNLPDIHGIELCRRIRAAGVDVDVIAISAVRDVAVIRASVNLGIVAYLIKPFAFPTFAERMRGYLAFRAGFERGPGVATQDEVDQSLARLRTPVTAPLEKGLSADTLDRIVGALRGRAEAMSASELAAELELSRVTARRYLEHLADEGSVDRSPRYGTPGRPELEYRWR